MMKFNKLTLAVLMATSMTLISCGDDEKTAEVKKDTPAAIEQKKINAAELAEIAETRYKNLANSNNQMFSAFSTTKRVPLDGKIVIEDYQRHENSATAKRTMTLTPSANSAFLKKPFVITSEDKIEYSPQLFQQGVIARIDSKIDYSELEKQWQEIFSEKPNAEIRKFVEEALKNVTLQTDLLPDDNVKGMLQVNPFTRDITTEEDKKETFDFQGADITFTFNEKESIEHVGVGKWQGNVKPLTIQSDQGSQFTVQAFHFESVLNPTGEMTAMYSPLQISFVEPEKEDDSFTFNIDGITKKGTGVIFDPDLGGYLGEVTGKIGDISVTKLDNGEKVIFGNSDFGSQFLKDEQGNYDLGGNFRFNFNEENLHQLFSDLPLVPKNLHISATVNNLSPEVFEISSKMLEVGQIEDEEAQKKAVLNLLSGLTNNLILNKTSLSGHIAVQTEKGDANFDYDFAPREGIDDVNWLEVFENSADDPMMFLYLLQEKVFLLLQKHTDFKVKLTINRDILAAFGMAEIVEMQGAGMIENQDGILTVTIENDADGLKVNGKPLPR